MSRYEGGPRSRRSKSRLPPLRLSFGRCCCLLLGGSGIILRGIDPAREGAVTGTRPKSITGNLDDLSRTKVVIPKRTGTERSGYGHAARHHSQEELSIRLGVFPGDTLNDAVSPVGPITGASMTPKSRQFVVVGIFQSGMYGIRFLLAYIKVGGGAKFSTWAPRSRASR